MSSDFAVDFDQDEALVAELHLLGIRHLIRLQPGAVYPPVLPEKLIAGLANHRQARFRTALILLFLRRPSLSGTVLTVLGSLAGPAADVLRLYYQAAAYLRPELETALEVASDDMAELPGLFSAELGLPAVGSVPTDAALLALGEAHTRLSGRAYNWAGSYRQHIPLFLRQLRSPAHADFSA